MPTTPAAATLVRLALSVLRPPSSSRWRRVRALSTIVLAVGTGASCDPCSGIFDCVDRDAHLIASMQVVRRSDGAAMRGVRVEVIRTDGAELDAPSMVGTTDDRGWVTLSRPASNVGAIRVDVEVTPPAPYVRYRVRDLILRTSGLRGDGNSLGRWVVDPYLQVLLEFQDAASGAKLAGARVDWQRVGGALVTPGANTTFTNEVGVILLDAAATGNDAVVFDFAVTRPGSSAPTWVRTVEIAPRHIDDPPYVQRIVPVGPPLVSRGSGPDAVVADAGNRGVAPGEPATPAGRGP